MQLIMRQIVAPAAAVLLLSGCMHHDQWSEAPRSAGWYESAAPVGWWGSNAASIDLFFGPLARHGTWAYHPTFGRVFVPAVGHGWQPYARGYWRHDPRWGRTWASSEPFGWATYHYGRWARDSRLGWFWVPDTRFAPHWVDWRHHGAWVSWSPLPPLGWNRIGGWGPDWWVHAPGSHLGRRDLYRHVRPGPVRVVAPAQPGSPVGREIGRAIGRDLAGDSSARPIEQAGEVRSARPDGWRRGGGRAVRVGDGVAANPIAPVEMPPAGASARPDRTGSGLRGGWRANPDAPRPGRTERPERPEGWQRPERPEGWQRPARTERPDGGQRPERAAMPAPRPERAERPAAPPRAPTGRTQDGGIVHEP